MKNAPGSAFCSASMLFPKFGFWKILAQDFAFCRAPFGLSLHICSPGCRICSSIWLIISQSAWDYVDDAILYKFMCIFLETLTTYDGIYKQAASQHNHDHEGIHSVWNCPAFFGSWAAVGLHRAWEGAPRKFKFWEFWLPTKHFIMPWILQNDICKASPLPWIGHPARHKKSHKNAHVEKVLFLA